MSHSFYIYVRFFLMLLLLDLKILYIRFFKYYFFFQEKEMSGYKHFLKVNFVRGE